jgi:hypothetical protein
LHGELKAPNLLKCSAGFAGIAEKGQSAGIEAAQEKWWVFVTGIFKRLAS